MRYFLSSQAETDIDEVVHFLAKEALNTALHFYENLEKTFEIIADNPLIGHTYFSLNKELLKVRYFPLKHFSKYLIFYIPTQKNITIIRVLHQARNIPLLLL